MTTATDVLVGNARWSCEAASALPWLRSLPDRAANLVFTSPPYEAQRTYGIGVKSAGQAWVDEMRMVVVEAARVSSGLPLAWGDNTAFGHSSKCGPGGEMSNRGKDGARVNGEKMAGASGDVMVEQNYAAPVIANPGNMIRAEPAAWDDAGGRVITARVGGGHLGHPLAHAGEAAKPRCRWPSRNGSCGGTARPAGSSSTRTAVPVRLATPRSNTGGGSSGAMCANRNATCWRAAWRR